MNEAEIKRTQVRVGTASDGFWGPKSTLACQGHLLRLMPARQDGFPTQGQVSSGKSIFGRHGVKDGYTPPMRRIRLPFALHLYGNTKNKVQWLSAHAACADSLRRVFVNLAEVFPTTAERKAAGVLDYFGIYNPRRMRGGSAWSLHAWAIAIDLDANRNRNRSHWPVASSMPIEVMECFAREGWLSAGAFWGRDAMHFQATAL